MHLLGALIVAATLVPQQVTATRFGRLVQRADPVYCAYPRGRNFALTFDDGPGPYTVELARVLRRHHARATFFVIGSRVGLFPDGTRAAARVGVLGNHTWSHAHLRALRAVTISDLLRRQPPSLAQLNSEGAARCPP